MIFQGIIFAISACFIWGLIFVVPQFMTGYNSIEVAFGRYGVFGLASLCLFLKPFLQGKFRYPRIIWMKALLFSLVSNIIYYIALVLSLRYSNPAICALILGLCPVAISFYGNWQEKECSFKDLIPSSLLIGIGLIVINAPQLMSNESPLNYLLGLLFCIIALVTWSWFAVSNSRFLRDYTSVSSNDWATLMGVATLFWVVLGTVICTLSFANDVDDVSEYVFSNILSSRFLIGSAVLGILCSWVGGYLWNQASLRLPISLAGQLTIFETIFGVTFVYSVAQQLPPPVECVGIALLLGGVAYTIRLSRNRKILHA